MRFLFLAFIILNSAILLAQETTPYRVYLKPGSVLETIKGENFSKSGRGIYVMAMATKSDRSQFYIFDKNKKPVYIVDANSIVEFEKDIQLLPNVDAETVYPAPNVLHSYNKYAFFDTQFNVHLDNLHSAGDYSNPYVIPSGLIATRFELRTLYTSQLPVNFGFTMNYQTSKWKIEDENIGTASLSIFSFGPQIQRYVYEEDNVAISLILGAEYAAIYNISTGELKDKYNGILLNLGAEVLWETSWGKWSLGTHYRRHDLKLISSSVTGFYSIPEDVVINSIGAMIGYKYEWNL